MNRRRFVQICLAGAVPAGLLAFQPQTCNAQGQPRPAGAQPRAQRQATPEQRPVGEPLHVEPLPPDLKKILKDWELASAKFKRLQGEHYRWIYDFVFNVEKQSKGNFWFDAPDKGRIDIDPWKSTGEPRKLDKNGKPLPGGAAFKVEPGKEEQWISTGTEIIQVNAEEKTIEVYPIPKEIQGQGIVESPLPFLFGMKADKAERRYKLHAGPFNDPENEAERPEGGLIHLIAFPRLQQDRQNWSRAEVMLDAQTFYPQAIKLIDPGGNSETVYRFFNVREPNLFENLRNPFNVNRPGFKRIVHQPAKEQAPAANGQVKMPRLIGQHYKKTKETLENDGYKVLVYRGVPAPQEQFTHYIYKQEPQPGAPLKKDVPIKLTLYLEPAVAAKPTGAQN